jgi:hypothetical protein
MQYGLRAGSFVNPLVAEAIQRRGDDLQTDLDAIDPAKKRKPVDAGVDAAALVEQMTPEAAARLLGAIQARANQQQQPAQQPANVEKTRAKLGN